MPALKSELDLFEQLLTGQFKSKQNSSAYLDKLSLNIIQSGGKRLRPAMMIASAKCGDYDREKVHHAAVSIELLHTATLVHDDIIDNAMLRRNMPTVSAAHGASTAVFTGDYLYVKSILALAMAELPVTYMQQVAKAVQAVCVGEVAEYRERGAIPTFKEYISRISKKTGVLFAASCALGAHIGKLPEAQVKLVSRFGGYFGIAFQIMDDLSDIQKGQNTAGKPVGNDLKEGIVTLPVLFAVAKNENMRKTVKALIKKTPQRKAKRSGKHTRMIIDQEAVDESKAILARYIGKANTTLQKLPDSEGKAMLSGLVHTVFTSYT